MSQAASVTISPQQVRHVAKLSRLALSDAEVERYAVELSAVLTYVEQLKAIDVSGVEPMAHALPVENVMGNDEPVEPLGVERALANAPQRQGSFFGVPKVLGGDDSG